MLCIYCRSDTTESTGAEHVIPAALACKDTLEPGYVCDKCNDYFAKMDYNFMLNRYIALFVGAQQIPNRNGRIRTQIGHKLNFPEFGSFLFQLCPDQKESTDRKWVYGAKQDENFDELLFARGVHKLAFNTFAYGRGGREAMHGRFDNLRRYIRRPDRGEIWPYAVGGAPYDGTYYASLHHDSAFTEVSVSLHVLCLNFFVFLSGSCYDLAAKATGQEVYVVSRKGQWQGSSILGLTR